MSAEFYALTSVNLQPSHKELIEMRWAFLRRDLMSALSRTKPDETLRYSLTSNDITFSCFATDSDADMREKFYQTLNQYPPCQFDALLSTFGDYSQWLKALVEIAPLWDLVAEGNRYARALTNGFLALFYFTDGVEIKYPIKPKICIEESLPELVLRSEFVTMLRFNLSRDENSREVQRALLQGKEGKLSIPPKFSATFFGENAEIVTASFRQYLGLRLAMSRRSKFSDAALAEKIGTFKAPVPDVVVSRAKLAVTFGLSASDYLDKELSVDAAQKRGNRRR